MAIGLSPADHGKGDQETPLLQLAMKLPTEDTRNGPLRLSNSKNEQIGQGQSRSGSAQLHSSTSLFSTPRQWSGASTALPHTGSTQNQQCPSCCTALESFPTLKGAQLRPTLELQKEGGVGRGVSWEAIGFSGRVATRFGLLFLEERTKSTNTMSEKHMLLQRSHSSFCLQKPRGMSSS